jgi:uncharacterized protein YjdB
MFARDAERTLPERVRGATRALSSREARLALLAVGLLSSSLAESASAQRAARADKPSGAEIAMKARAARLDRANAGTGQFQGKRIAFTPAQLDPRADLSSGQVIGLLENDVEGDETGLPVGRYNVFAAQLADGWHVYAESGGQIVREALRVTVTQRPGAPTEKKPRIRPVGWGVDIDRTREPIPLPPPVATINIVGNGTTTLLVGEKRQFGIELRDASGNVLTGRSITWTSSAPAIVSAPTVGVANGMAGGSATLTATSEGKTAQVTLQVPPIQYRIYVGALVVDGAYTVETSVAASTNLGTYIEGSPCTYPCPPINWSELTWTSSAPTIARVTPTAGGPARLDGVAEGTATITASYRGASVPVKVTVGRARASVITLTPASLTVHAGQTQQLSAVVRDATGAIVTDRPITWQSGNTSVADVTPSGRVAGIIPGFANIYASAENARTSLPVYVIPPAVATVTLDPATLSVQQNQWGELKATLRDQSGAELTGRSIIWTSNNPAIAEVTYSGRVVGIAPGTATITATSEGRSGRATVAVTASEVASAERLTESISFNW